jgi:ketosteroid isomerase-like protein
MFRPIVLSACAVLLALSAGCSGGSNAADATAIKAKSELWSKAGSVKDSASFATFYADDATVMFPHEPVFKGMDAIKAVLTPMMQDPNYSLSFTTDRVEVSGILAYTQGAVSLRTTARDGKPFPDTGKYLAVWKKQSDGSWKVIEHIFNSDLPIEPPEPPARGKQAH